MIELGKPASVREAERDWRRILSPAIQHARSKAAAFRRDEKGTIAIIFALMTVVVSSLVGGAVDFGRAVTVREQMQNAVDASVLAAARVWQTEQNLAQAEQHALKYYAGTKPDGAHSSVTRFEPDLARNSIVMEAQATVAAPFLSMVMPDGFTVRASAEALLAAGGNGDTSLEISMMLDVTGSMSGTKITDLKAAAKDLIDIVVWSDQSTRTSKVAIVPFANGVNLGSTTLVDQVRGTLKTGSCLSSSSPCTAYTTNTSPTSTQWTWGAPATFYRFTNTSGSTSTFRASSYCVSERIGTDRYTDAAPNAAARRVGPIYQSGNSSEADRCSMVKGTNYQINAVVPLSSNKDALKQHVDNMQLAGATAGQIGTAWAWYMLSPNWSYLWPQAHRPVAYNTEGVQKIAILMTDGEYNTAHCNGVMSMNSANNGTRINCNANNGISDTQADEMCAAMKNGTGITVYTVGFALGGNTTAINTLRNCASDASKFYEASDGAELRQAFRDIALQVAKLRLSQ
jgi:Flp pilus assembly protein TadG